MPSAKLEQNKAGSHQAQGSALWKCSTPMETPLCCVGVNAAGLVLISVKCPKNLLQPRRLWIDPEGSLASMLQLLHQHGSKMWRPGTTEWVEVRQRWFSVWWCVAERSESTRKVVQAAAMTSFLKPREVLWARVAFSHAHLLQNLALIRWWSESCSWPKMWEEHCVPRLHSRTEATVSTPRSNHQTAKACHWTPLTHFLCLIKFCPTILHLLLSFGSLLFPTIREMVKASLCEVWPWFGGSISHRELLSCSFHMDVIFVVFMPVVHTHAFCQR